MSLRLLEQFHPGMPTTDGAGVALLRIIGTPRCDHVDPFLLLDEFKNADPSAYIAGFPEHPHRGFETVTYMLRGRMRHKDSVGNSGLLTDGMVQWMTAGRGILHSEMPEQTDGPIWGFQLWVNLPARLKMTAPRYQDIPRQKIPTAGEEGIQVRVIAGTWGKTTGPVETHWPVEYFDVKLKPDEVFRHRPPDGHTAIAYVYEGGIVSPSESSLNARVEKQHLAVFGRTGELKITGNVRGASFLLFTGAPIGEPVARMGPFVMNTREELQQAVADYHAGRLAT